MKFDMNDKKHVTAAIAVAGLSAFATSAIVKKAIKRKKQRENFIKAKEEFEELIDVLCELSCEVVRLSEENDELRLKNMPEGCKILRHPSKYRN